MWEHVPSAKDGVTSRESSGDSPSQEGEHPLHFRSVGKGATMWELVFIYGSTGSHRAGEVREHCARMGVR
jgi:hypothetical protein